MNKPVVLCILDGCGLREDSDGNAFKNAKKPTFDMLVKKYPHSILQASGPYVGLPEGLFNHCKLLLSQLKVEKYMKMKKY